MTCSCHFKQRCKERLGLNKQASESLFRKAVMYGIPVEEVKSKPGLYRYLRYLETYNSTKKGRSLLIYNYNIIVFRTVDTRKVGVTILDIPKEYHAIIDIIKKERKDKENGCKISKRQDTNNITNS